MLQCLDGDKSGIFGFGRGQHSLGFQLLLNQHGKKCAQTIARWRVPGVDYRLVSELRGIGFQGANSFGEKLRVVGEIVEQSQTAPVQREQAHRLPGFGDPGQELEQLLSRVCLVGEWSIQEVQDDDVEPAITMAGRFDVAESPVLPNDAA